MVLVYQQVSLVKILDITIDIGGAASTGATHAGSIMGFQATTDAMVVDGITYTFPLYGATVVVGDTTDISSTFTGACAYSAFTDYMGNCGTGNSVGVGGKGVTASVGYAFDSGLSIAGGVSFQKQQSLQKSLMIIMLLSLHSSDTYGAAILILQDGGTGLDTTYVGVTLSIFQRQKHYHQLRWL